MTLTQAIETAKAKAANHPEWMRAIDKAAKLMASGELCVTLFADNTALVTSPNASYRVNGACPCAARTAHCYHRAAKRLVEMMETAPAEASSAVLVTDSFAGRVETPVEVVGETPTKTRIRAITDTEVRGLLEEITQTNGRNPMGYNQHTKNNIVNGCDNIVSNGLRGRPTGNSEEQALRIHWPFCENARPAYLNGGFYDNRGTTQSHNRYCRQVSTGRLPLRKRQTASHGVL